MHPSSVILMGHAQFSHHPVLYNTTGQEPPLYRNQFKGDEPTEFVADEK